MSSALPRAAGSVRALDVFLTVMPDADAGYGRRRDATLFTGRLR